MTGATETLPKPAHDFISARAVLRSATATPGEIAAACCTLSWSHDWQDIQLVRETRTAMWSTRDSELLPETHALAARLAELPPIMVSVDPETTDAHDPNAWRARAIIALTATLLGLYIIEAALNLYLIGGN
jgi:hypothetical protein